MPRINFFRLSKNKKFNYTPRYYKGKKDHNIYDFGSKFARNRENFNTNDYRNHWASERIRSRNRKNRAVSRTLILIILVLVFFFLYIIDFDYTIFFN
ncbi:MAG: hypothetical protein OXC03_04925 [Flavobacteriaceae bacterium]|nr:hypothetical protein [Flavobacteriaceae bacterium]